MSGWRRQSGLLFFLRIGRKETDAWEWSEDFCHPLPPETIRFATSTARLHLLHSDRRQSHRQILGYRCSAYKDFRGIGKRSLIVLMTSFISSIVVVEGRRPTRFGFGFEIASRNFSCGTSVPRSITKYPVRSSSCRPGFFQYREYRL